MAGNIAVLQVLPSLVTGGVERGTIEIDPGDRRGRVDCAGGQRRRPPGVRRSSAPAAATSRCRWPAGIPFDLAQRTAAWQALIRAEQVAIVHARSRAPAWSAWLACRRTGAHFVTTYHGTYNEDLPFKRRYNSVMARGERVIAASRFIADLIQRQHDTDPSRIRIIPRGVDPAVFDPGAVAGHRVARLALEWRLPDGASVVLLPGRLTSWKGQTVLIEALARLSGRNVCCVLVGSDQGRRRYAAGLIRQAEALGVADRVRLVGECDDMPAALMLADVVVHASTQPEAFGRVVIEAQAMGRPVIASDLGGPIETVEHGVTGWRVPPGDAGALAAAIEMALALPAEERQALGCRARAAVLRGYTVGAMQAATLDVYREIMGLA